MGRHVQRALDDLRISRIHLALVAILVSFVLTAESCSGTAQGVGGGAPSTSPSSVIATATPAPETLATATPTATPRATPVATPVPTISRAAAPAPTLSRAPASKPAPLPGRITFPAGPASGHPGQVATLGAHYTPGVLCTIVVHYKSGPSKAQGLGAKRTDGSGNVSWSWIIGTNTTRGQWPITVTCGSASAQSYINVI